MEELDQSAALERLANELCEEALGLHRDHPEAVLKRDCAARIRKLRKSVEWATEEEAPAPPALRDEGEEARPAGICADARLYWFCPVCGDNKPETGEPFAVVDAEDLDEARRDPKVQELQRRADEHLAELEAEGRIDLDRVPDDHPAIVNVSSTIEGLRSMHEAYSDGRPPVMISWQASQLLAHAITALRRAYGVDAGGEYP